VSEDRPEWNRPEPGTPSTPPLRRAPVELEVRSAEQLDHTVGDTVLLEPVLLEPVLLDTVLLDTVLLAGGRRAPIIEPLGYAQCVPLHVGGDRGRRPVRPPERLVRIVERHGMALVADRPLCERIDAVVLGPHLGSLDDERIRSHGDVPLGEMEHRATRLHHCEPIPGPLPDETMARHEAR
jgi:hypothetical protein